MPCSQPPDPNPISPPLPQNSPTVPLKLDLLSVLEAWQKAQELLLQMRVSSKMEKHLLSKPGSKIFLEPCKLGLGFQQQPSSVGCCYFCHVKARIETLADAIQDCERPHNKCESGREPAANACWLRKVPLYNSY